MTKVGVFGARRYVGTKFVPHLAARGLMARGAARSVATAAALLPAPQPRGDDRAAACGRRMRSTPGQ